MKLETVCEINPRLPNNSDELQNVSFLPMSSVSEKGKLLTQETRVLSETKKGFTYFERGDILLAKITPCFENGKAVFTSGLEYQIGYGSTEFHVIRAIQGKANGKYLFYLIWNDAFRFHGQHAMKGAAGQKRVSAEFLKKFKIPLPPMAEQQKIAAILDAADNLRQKDQQLIEHYTALSQSLFLEMFGDPLANENEYEIVNLNDVTSKITDGVHAKPDYTDKGVSFISVKDVTTGTLIFDNCKFISEEAHDKYFKRCNPELGDIIYTKVGATYGRAVIVDVDFPFSLYVSVALIKPIREIINPVFLKEAMVNPAVKRQADKAIKGIGVPDLHLNMIKKFRIPLPPITLQNQFAERIQAIEAQKQQAQASLEKSETLFNSLLQRAFKGELTA